MHIQIVNFNLKGLTHDAYTAFCVEIAAQFADVPGLVAKTWLSDVKANIYGGVYLWDSEASMARFAQSELFKGVVSHPNLENITSRDFDVLEAPSRVTNGVGSVDVAA